VLDLCDEDIPLFTKETFKGCVVVSRVLVAWLDREGLRGGSRLGCHWHVRRGGGGPGRLGRGQRNLTAGICNKIYKHAAHMQSIMQKYAEICRKYEVNMQYMHLDICNLYAEKMQRICNVCIAWCIRLHI
jgi:hypothetical protein